MIYAPGFIQVALLPLLPRNGKQQVSISLYDKKQNVNLYQRDFDVSEELSKHFEIAPPIETHPATCANTGS